MEAIGKDHYKFESTDKQHYADSQIIGMNPRGKVFQGYSGGFLITEDTEHLELAVYMADMWQKNKVQCVLNCVENLHTEYDISPSGGAHVVLGVYEYSYEQENKSLVIEVDTNHNCVNYWKVLKAEHSTPDNDCNEYEEGEIELTDVKQLKSIMEWLFVKETIDPPPVEDKEENEDETDQ